MAQWVYLIPTVLGEILASRRRNRHPIAERDDSHIARDLPERFDDLVTRSLPQLPFDNQPAIRSPLVEVEDRRTWHPDRVLPVRSSRRRQVRLEYKARRAGMKLARFSFHIPEFPYFRQAKYVAICVRRKERREVLFATRGRGKGARTPKRRNRWSNVRC